jgi:hypothetical protein
VVRSLGYYSLFFEKTDVETQSLCLTDTLAFNCVLLRDPNTEKVRALHIPLGCHLWKPHSALPPLELTHHYEKDLLTAPEVMNATLPTLFLLALILFLLLVVQN